MSVHTQQDFITCRKHAGTSEWLSLETERALLIMFFQHSLDLKKKKKPRLSFFMFCLGRLLPFQHEQTYCLMALTNIRCISAAKNGSLV